MFYCDWKETFDALPNDKAGELIKHILSYVNDENPESKDILINAVFANIKATLKRDLKKWEQKSNKNRESANMRWQKENANECERINEDAKNADRDKVTVTDTVIDKVIVNVKEKVNKKEVNFSQEVFQTFDEVLNYFTLNLQPNSKKKKDSWLETIDKLNRIDKIPFEKIIEITKKTREDPFWSTNFLTLNKLRSKDPHGIPYIVVFNEKIKPNGHNQKHNNKGATEDELARTLHDHFLKQREQNGGTS